jgi:hypothetical protein
MPAPWRTPNADPARGSADQRISASAHQEFRYLTTAMTLRCVCSSSGGRSSLVNMLATRFSARQATGTETGRSPSWRVPAPSARGLRARGRSAGRAGRPREDGGRLPRRRTFLQAGRVTKATADASIRRLMAASQPSPAAMPQSSTTTNAALPTSDVIRLPRARQVPGRNGPSSSHFAARPGAPALAGAGAIDAAVAVCSPAGPTIRNTDVPACGASLRPGAEAAARASALTSKG